MVGNILRCKRVSRWRYLFYSAEKKKNDKAAVSWEGRIKAIKSEVRNLRYQMNLTVDKKLNGIDRMINDFEYKLSKKMDAKFGELLDKSQNIGGYKLENIVAKVLD